MPLPWNLNHLLAWPFAVYRIDTWVLIASIAILLMCIAGLGLWRLIAYLFGKLPKKPRMARQSPEPPSAILAPKLLPHVRVQGEAAPSGDDPEKLQQACSALETSLAEVCMELAESWLRRGQPQKAAVALRKILQICPDRHQAKLAEDRLQQIGNEVEDHPSKPT